MRHFIGHGRRVSQKLASRGIWTKRGRSSRPGPDHDPPPEGFPIEMTGPLMIFRRSTAVLRPSSSWVTIAITTRAHTMARWTATIEQMQIAMAGEPAQDESPAVPPLRPVGRTLHSASSPPLKQTPAHQNRSTSPSTGSAGNRYSGTHHRVPHRSLTSQPHYGQRRSRPESYFPSPTA
jgi:hypothetical protein